MVVTEDRAVTAGTRDSWSLKKQKNMNPSVQLHLSSSFCIILDPSPWVVLSTLKGDLHPLVKPPYRRAHRSASYVTGSGGRHQTQHFQV